MALAILALASCAPVSATIPEPTVSAVQTAPEAPAHAAGQTFGHCASPAEATMAPGWTYCPASLEDSSVALFDDQIRVRPPWGVRLVDVDENTVAMEPRAVRIEPCLSELPDGRLHYFAIGSMPRDDRPLPEIAHAILQHLGYPEEACVMGQAHDEKRGRLRLVFDVPAPEATPPAEAGSPFARPHHPDDTRGLLRVVLNGDTAYYVVAEAEHEGWATIERTLDGTVGSMVLMSTPDQD